MTVLSDGVTGKAGWSANSNDNKKVRASSLFLFLAWMHMQRADCSFNSFLKTLIGFCYNFLQYVRCISNTYKVLYSREDVVR
jgi:hypothetical protein